MAGYATTTITLSSIRSICIPNRSAFLAFVVTGVENSLDRRESLIAGESFGQFLPDFLRCTLWSTVMGTV
jgi:hypothetical protein